MELDIDSDIGDFWEDYDNSLGTQGKSIISDDKKQEEIQNKIPSFNFYESVKSLRRFRKEEERSMKYEEEDIIRPYIDFSLQKIKKKFENQLQMKKIDKLFLQKEISSEDKTNKIIHQYLIDKELQITQARIGELKLNPPVINYSELEYNKKLMKKEIGLSKIKADALKRAIKQFQEDKDINHSKLIEITDILNNDKKKISNEYQEIENQLKFQYEQGKNQNNSLRLEYQIFKQNKIKELEVLEQKCKNNSELITSLQEELRTAKKVLKNPEVKNKVYNKLQEYVEDFDRKNLSICPSTKNSKTLRRRVYSTKAVSRANHFQAESKLNSTPKQSNFKFYFIKPKLEQNKTSQPEYKSTKVIKLKSSS